MRVFLCIEKGTDKILSPMWHATRAHAEQSITFFSTDHFAKPAPCVACGYVDPPRDNPWKRAEVREIEWGFV